MALCDENCKCEEVQTAVEFIRSRRQGQYYESIVNILSTNHEYNEETSKSMIDLAVNHNILRETKNQNKISYRINNLTAPNVTLKDYVENSETQTEDHEQQEIKSLADDLQDFKKFVSEKLSLLLEARENINFEPFEVNRDFLVEGLKKRINELEQEVIKKNSIIDFILTNSIYDSKQKEQAQTGTYRQYVGSNDQSNKLRNNQVSSAGENYKHRKNNNTKNLSSSERKAHNILESKKVEIIGDSMLYGINEKGLCKGHKVKVRSYPGSTTEDICDYINPAIRRKPDVVIIHSGTNDLSHEIQTINKMKSVVKQVRNSIPNTKIVISGVIGRKDKKDLEVKVSDLNSRLKNYCKQQNIDFIDNQNIDGTCLGAKKLHLNKKGNSIFAKNILTYLDQC